MQRVERQLARREGQLSVCAQVAWETVIDWGNLDWWGCGIDSPGPEIGPVVLEQQSALSLPTRLIQMKAEPLLQIRETLLAIDADCYRLHYRTSDGFLPGIKNYIASWAFTPTAQGGCMMLIESMFDVVAPGDGTPTREMIEMMYGFINTGLDNYLRSGTSVVGNGTMR